MKVSRLNSIEQYVISRETVSIDELCEVFGVSKNTIRRDLSLSSAATSPRYTAA